MNTLADVVTDLELALTEDPDLPCACRPSVHRLHGRGAVRYLVHQRCPGCGREDRGWACEGCATWAKSPVEGVHLQGGCTYRAPIRDFLVSIEVAR